MMDPMGNLIYTTLPPEDDDGFIEYKWNLAKTDGYKNNKIISQMKWRVLQAGDNKSAIYILGIHDNGNLTGLSRAALNATYTTLADCASRARLCSCIMAYKNIPHTDKYWAVLQIFIYRKAHSDDIPNAPLQELPEYINKLITGYNA